MSPDPTPAQQPQWKQALPEPSPTRAPRIATAPLREPSAALVSRPPQIAADPEPATPVTTLPTLTQPEAALPPLAGPADYAKIAASRIQPAVGNSKPSTVSAKEQLSLPGPTLPHELTSLQAAGINKVLVQRKQTAPAARSGWALSVMVAAFVLAGTLGAAFYAMPGLANVAPEVPQAQQRAAEVAKAAPPPVPVPADPLARIVEVTGVRFVTDLPGHAPEIHYLVVNHGNVPLLGVTVHVTLHTSADAPLTQFAFRAPKLGPYESKEMVSSIERFDRSVSLPDWRDLRADVQLSR